jgi:hypothetical protein
MSSQNPAATVIDVPKKRVIQKQTKNDEVDDLDGLMGFGGEK